MTLTVHTNEVRVSEERFQSAVNREFSQNGWSVIDQENVRQWRVPGFTQVTLPLRKGPVGFILVHLALFYHEEIERLDLGYDDWGYAKREIAGSNTWSNHASGTAIDLNALRHPQGSVDTFTEAQADKLWSRLSRIYMPIIRWGGTFRTTPDEMHFEIAVPPGDQRIAELADYLRRTQRGIRVTQAND